MQHLLQELSGISLRLSSKVATHIQLNAKNFAGRSTWFAAMMLSTDAAEAQASALCFRDELRSDGQKNAFET